MNLTNDEYMTCEGVIKRLSELAEYNAEAVVDIVRGIGTNVFMALDEKPGHWGYEAPNGNEWHYLLRRARNSAEGFFEALADTSNWVSTARDPEEYL